MIERTLLAHGIGADRVSVIIDEQDAIEAALRMAAPGDLVLIFADALARGWKQITHFRADAAPAPLASQKKQVPQTVRPDVIELADDSVPPPRAVVAPVRSPPTNGTVAAVAGTIAGTMAVVRDDRGVFLAREAND